MSLKLYIERLEQFSARCGAPVIRDSLSAGISGRIEERHIVLGLHLNADQQVLTLVHELTHLIVHCHAIRRLNRTVCEYEAEAVERWVGIELGVRPYAAEVLDVGIVTEDLLACSVARVRWAAETLVSAARSDDAAAVNPRRLEAQPAVEI